MIIKQTVYNKQIYTIIINVIVMLFEEYNLIGYESKCECSYV